MKTLLHFIEGIQLLLLSFNVTVGQRGIPQTTAPSKPKSYLLTCRIQFVDAFLAVACNSSIANIEALLMAEDFILNARSHLRDSISFHNERLAVSAKQLFIWSLAKTFTAPPL